MSEAGNEDRATRQDALATLDVTVRASAAYGRADLAERLGRTRDRLGDPAFHVLVIGEFKQGKSSLINALLGWPVCPVDDDVATAVPTLLRYSDAPTASVLMRGDGEDSPPVIEQVPVDLVPTYVTEAANPDNQRQVSTVEIGVPVELLRSGLVLVDTPGVGGLGSAHSTITIGALPMADAVLFVSDTSQEFSGPEIEFLRTARKLCPTTIGILTKTDFYPAWRKILELDAGHLEREGIPMPLLPVSSALQYHASVLQDAELQAESGFTELRGYLQTQLLDRGEHLVLEAAAADMLSVVAQLESQFGAEHAVLVDPAGAAEVVRQREAAREAAERLRSAQSRWMLLLNDGFVDLQNDVEHDLRAAIRNLMREADDALDASDPGESWEEFANWLERQAAESVVRNYGLLHTRAAQVADQVAELFSLDGSDVVANLPVENPDDLLADATRSLRLELTEGDRSGAGLSVLRGSYGGMLMFGMLSRMVGLALINPATMALGLLMGRKAFKDERNRALAQRRAQAKNAHRRYLDELSFEIAKDSRDTVRKLQRRLRDTFGNRAEELHRFTSASLAQAQAAVATGEQSREQRLADVEAELARIRVLRAAIMALAGSGG
jgi:hypothetical protein